MNVANRKFLFLFLFYIAFGYVNILGENGVGNSYRTKAESLRSATSDRIPGIFTNSDMPVKDSVLSVGAEQSTVPSAKDSSKISYQEHSAGKMQMPEYPGGVSAMTKFLSKNTLYPRSASLNNITGRVVVQFVIDSTGVIQKIWVKKGIGYGCDEEAVRVIRSMPKWQPARKDGKPVNIIFTVPLVFSNR